MVKAGVLEFVQPNIGQIAQQSAFKVVSIGVDRSQVRVLASSALPPRRRSPLTILMPDTTVSFAPKTRNTPSGRVSRPIR